MELLLRKFMNIRHVRYLQHFLPLKKIRFQLLEIVMNHLLGCAGQDQPFQKSMNMITDCNKTKYYVFVKLMLLVLSFF